MTRIAAILKCDCCPSTAEGKAEFKERCCKIMAIVLMLLGLTCFVAGTGTTVASVARPQLLQSIFGSQVQMEFAYAFLIGTALFGLCAAVAGGWCRFKNPSEDEEETTPLHLSDVTDLNVLTDVN